MIVRRVMVGSAKAMQREHRSPAPTMWGFGRRARAVHEEGLQDGLGNGCVSDPHALHPRLFSLRNRLSSNLDFRTKPILLFSIVLG